MLDLSSRKVYGALAEQCVGGDAKADKVETAVAGHLAGLDSNGNLMDSGVSPTEEVTVEGNPVTFDSPFEQDAKSVVVSVKPIQDLHGLPFPYVGGAYKNKLMMSLSAIKSVNTQGTWNDNVYTRANVTFTVFTDNGDNVIGFKVNGTPSEDCSLRIDSAIEANENYILNGCPANGSYDTYGLTVLNQTWGNAKDDYGNGVAFSYNSSSVHLSMYVKTGYNAQNLMFYPMIRLATESDSTFAPYSNICPISGIDEVEIEVSDGESEPTTTTIPLPSTLYDADVDVTEGDGTDNSGLAVFDGSDDEGWGYFDGVFYCDFSNAKLSQVAPTSNWLKGVSNKDYTLLNNGEFAFSIVNAGNANFRLDSITNLADWKTYLASNPLEVCYELATTTTISFTPATIELLEGTNVVSTNAEKVAVTYGRSLWQDIDDLKTDTEGKLNKSDVATIEGDTASKAYAVNDFMLRADGFYKVTQPIAQNASITASNTTKTTIGAVLTALLNA